MKIYFAGSIRGGRQLTETYKKLIEILKPYGEVLTEHIGNQQLSEVGEPGLTDKQIFHRDLEWLVSSDVLIAEVTIPSLGVGYEIGKAEALGKPILCLSQKSKISAMIVGNPVVTFLYYKNLEEAKEAINDFFEKNF